MDSAIQAAFALGRHIGEALVDPLSKGGATREEQVLDILAEVADGLRTFLHPPAEVMSRFPNATAKLRDMLEMATRACIRQEQAIAWKLIAHMRGETLS